MNDRSRLIIYSIVIGILFSLEVTFGIFTCLFLHNILQVPAESFSNKLMFASLGFFSLALLILLKYIPDRIIELVELIEELPFKSKEKEKK